MPFVSYIVRCRTIRVSRAARDIAAVAIALLSTACGSAEDAPGLLSSDQAAKAGGGSALWISVSSMSDSGKGSLRAAITQANRASSSKYTSVSIQIAPGTYTLARCGSDDTNAAGDLDILTNLPVTLVGASSAIQQSCIGERVLDDRGRGVLTLSSLTVRGGSTNSPGGGVSAFGDVVLQRATIAFNSAIAWGGGLYVGGSLHATDSILSDNSVNGVSNAEGAGAYVNGAITIVGGAIRDNQAVAGASSPMGGSARGGGIAQNASSAAAVSVSDTLFSNNRATAGEGDYSSGEASGGALAAAGPLHAANVTANGNLAISAATQNTTWPVSGGDARGGAFAALGAASIEAGTFSDNQASSTNVGTTSLMAPSSPSQVCWGNTWPPSSGAGVGGAIWSAAQTTLTGGTFRHNIASTSAALVRVPCNWGTSCIFPFPDCPSNPSFSSNGVGGAVASGGILEATGGEYTLNDAAGSGAAALSGSSDGRLVQLGIHDNLGGDAVAVSGHLRISSSQLIANGFALRAASIDADNVSIADHRSGGLAANTALLVNTTLSGNAGPAVIASRLSLDHGTIADNAAGLQVSHLSSQRSVISSASDTPICPGSVIIDSSGFNFYSDASCGLSGAGDQQGGANFALGPLADNGGPVLTRAPAATSVLVDAIPTSACPVHIDARGVARPQGPACDVGAVEVQGP